MPPGVIVIQLKYGFETVIDPQDGDLCQFRWYLLSPLPGRHYVVREDHRKYCYLARVILARIVGRPLERGEECDHINLDTLDNRRANLRISSRAENNRNRRRQKSNSSGFKNVYYKGGRKPWASHIYVNGKHIRLGSFVTPEEAYAAYLEAVKLYHDEFARTE